MKTHFEKRFMVFQFLQETSPILAVKVKGQEDPILIQTGVKGKLIEVNPAIVSNPKLLLDESEGRGFIAILLPKVKSYNQFQEINFETQTLCSHRPSYNLKCGASSRLLLSLYCPMWNSDRNTTN